MACDVSPVAMFFFFWSLSHTRAFLAGFQNIKNITFTPGRKKQFPTIIVCLLLQNFTMKSSQHSFHHWKTNMEIQGHKYRWGEQRNLSQPHSCSDRMACFRQLLFCLRPPFRNYSSHSPLHLVLSSSRAYMKKVHFQSWEPRWHRWWRARRLRRPSTLQVDGRSSLSWTIFSLLAGSHHSSVV